MTVPQNLARANDQLRAFIRYAPVCIAMFDREMNYLAASDRWMTHYSRGYTDLVGRSHYQVHPDLPEWWKAVHRRALSGETLENKDELWIHEDRTEQWLSWAVLPWRQEDGAIGGIVISTEDITERKQKEAERGRLIQDLCEAQAKLEQANRTLIEADQRKNEFLGMLSHELRNPLAAILTSAYLLESAAQRGDQAQCAQEVIHRQVEHLTRLVDDLLDITRLTRGKIRLQCEALDLNELLARAVEDHRASFQRSGVALEVDAAPGEVWVNGDRTRLAQVLGNLLQNAVKFTPRGGSATVSLEVKGGQAIVRVKDTGSGIEPEMLQRVFEPFTQVSASIERSAGGLGLGLAIVKSLMEPHGGSVRAESEGLGKGGTFTLAMPLAAPGPQTEGKRESDVQEVKRRVVIIEDQRDAADMLRDVLTLWGHEVEVAYSGTEGLDVVRRAQPAAVICDIGLPGMNGYEVARALRASLGEPRSFLIALSGYAGATEVAKAREAGFDAHMAKPPNLDRLKRILATLRPSD